MKLAFQQDILEIDKVAKALQQLLNFWTKRSWVSDRTPSVDNVTFFVNQEFFEVPFDTPQAQQTRLLGLQKFVNWVSTITVHVNFLQHWERNTIVQRTERSNFFIRTWFLFAELVTWETDDFKAFVVVLGVQFL